MASQRNPIRVGGPGNNVLIAVALEQEIDLRPYGLFCRFTGVGKINATYELGRAISDHWDLSLVLNLGTAGSSKFPPGTVVLCHRFMQWDMDCSPLGFKPGQTPFGAQAPILSGMSLHGFTRATCASGDSFVTDPNRCPGADVFDMEAFALASVCHRERLQFASLKYITDGADETAAADWTNRHAHNGKLMTEAIRFLDAVSVVSLETIPAFVA